MNINLSFENVTNEEMASLFSALSGAFPKEIINQMPVPENHWKPYIEQLEKNKESITEYAPPTKEEQEINTKLETIDKAIKATKKSKKVKESVPEPEDLLDIVFPDEDINNGDFPFDDIEDEEETVTRETLGLRLQKIARADKENRPKIIKLLNEKYKAEKMSDLTDEQLKPFNKSLDKAFPNL